MAVLTVAIVHETFHGADGPERLAARLREAGRRGADLAVLPELPLNDWAPATRTSRPEDAEEPEGSRHRIMAGAARDAEIGVLGGVIVREPASGRRLNRALLFDARGRLVAAYDKAHLPSEEGFWESDHYETGDEAPKRIDGFALPLGIQICSDLNRPQGCLMLGAQGVGAILAPRATPLETYERWRLVLRANAVTSSTYIVSVNRPGPEAGVGIGGPSILVAPDGGVVLETTDPLSVARLDAHELAAARRDYPGYLPMRVALYARGWSEIAD
jgi:N-carbamoylputrescine amidase